MHSRPLTKEETLLRSLQRPSSDSDFVHVDTKYKDINSNVSSFGVIAYILSLGLGEKKEQKTMVEREELNKSYLFKQCQQCCRSHLSAHPGRCGHRARLHHDSAVHTPLTLADNEQKKETKMYDA